MRVFIADDQLDLAVALKRGLERSGFAVDHSSNGAEAANHFITHHASYDALLLDLNLPDQSGEEICQAVRRRGIVTPILILSAAQESDRKVELLNGGADDYLAKPFDFVELVARINALLRRPVDAPSEEEVVGELRLCTARHRAYAGEHPLPLTTKEFALLAHFMRHPNEVQTRQSILEEVWDLHYSSFSNVVDVHIKNLRKKLQEATGSRCIETVEGVGYVLRR